MRRTAGWGPALHLESLGRGGGHTGPLGASPAPSRPTPGPGAWLPFSSTTHTSHSHKQNLGAYFRPQTWTLAAK